jgi:hypothetical protein
MHDSIPGVVHHAVPNTAPKVGRRAVALRAAHVLIALVELGSLGYVWTCALTGRRDLRLRVAVAFLAGEGIGLVVGRGDCPLAPLQQRWGDPVPLFEFVLPPRAAKAAVPILATITVGGLLALLARRPLPAAHETLNRHGAVLGRLRQRSEVR